MTKNELKEVLKKHKEWLIIKKNGEHANLRDADLRDADLRDANLRGADLSGADLNGADLSGADLSGADLSGADLRCANLRGADLRCANLRDANLRCANLSDADLRGADLSDANLSDAHLPETIGVENLFIKIKAIIENGGHLEMGDWHKNGYCGTTHCMAGFVTTLGGETGRVMENLLGTPWAATLIILKSCLYLEGKVPNFYADNEKSMNFINECAEKEKDLVKS